MEVLVDEPGVVEPGGEVGQDQGEVAPELPLPVRRHQGEPSLDELVERQGVGDLLGDQVIFEQEPVDPALAEGDRRDGRHADRFELGGASALVTPFAAAEPLAGLGPEVGHEEVLDVDRAFGQVGPVDDPMRASLDGGQPAGPLPLVERQPPFPEQCGGPVGADPPARVVGLRPVPRRGLEHAGARPVLRPRGQACRFEVGHGDHPRAGSPGRGYVRPSVSLERRVSVLGRIMKRSGIAEEAGRSRLAADDLG